MRNNHEDLSKAKLEHLPLWQCDVCDLWYSIKDYLYCPNCGYDDVKVNAHQARLKLRKLGYLFDHGGFVIQRPENEMYYYIFPQKPK